MNFKSKQNIQKMHKLELEEMQNPEELQDEICDITEINNLY